MRIAIIRGIDPEEFFPIVQGHKKPICAADAVLDYYGIKHVKATDIENLCEFIAAGCLKPIEANRLFAKNGRLYVFKEWSGEWPFDGVVMERIGFVK